MSIEKKQIEELIQKQKAAFISDFKKIVESPSVSSAPEHKKDIAETARIAADFLRAAGAEVTIVETKGNPVVFGHIENKPGAPTAAVYNHLDVQPATKGKDGWIRDPFVFTEEKGRFYSRGTTDDKGPALTALWGAKMAREFKLPINFEFIWELEEEIGSPNFEEFITKAKGLIKAKSIIVSDTVWLEASKPAVTQALRGLVTMMVRLRTAAKDGHSGMVGGAARNPITELCELVSTMVDARTGKIKIPGFDKTWTPPSKEMLGNFVASGFSVASFKKAHELEKMRTEVTEEVTARIWAMPTCEVHGIAGGVQGDGVKTIVPSKAEAKISFRLIPGQDPDEVLALVTKHIQTINPDCEVHVEGKLRPYSAAIDLPETKAVMDAVEFGFGIRPVFTMEGGSIGAVVTMEKNLKLPIVFMGISLPEDGYHCPNESFAWTQIEGGVKAWVKYFETLSSMK